MSCGLGFWRWRRLGRWRWRCGCHLLLLQFINRAPQCSLPPASPCAGSPAPRASTGSTCSPPPGRCGLPQRRPSRSARAAALPRRRRGGAATSGISAPPSEPYLKGSCLFARHLQHVVAHTPKCQLDVEARRRQMLEKRGRVGTVDSGAVLGSRAGPLRVGDERVGRQRSFVDLAVAAADGAGGNRAPHRPDEGIVAAGVENDEAQALGGLQDLATRSSDMASSCASMSRSSTASVGIR